jgi:multidrug efflux pump
VILVVQIDQSVAQGDALWDAIIASAVKRFRPIMLTALAAILGMIPLTRSTFWGPMAWAIMGGQFIATLLTLLFFPALYAAVYGAKRPPKPIGVTAADREPATVGPQMFPVLNSLLASPDR